MTRSLASVLGGGARKATQVSPVRALLEVGMVLDEFLKI